MNDERGDDVQIRVASEWVGLSLRRVLGFGRRVGGGKPSTNENHEPSANGRCANESRFGLGGIVPAAGSGFRRAWLWGKAVHEFFPRINEWTMCKWQSLRSGRACPCGGLWVSGGVSVGLVN